MRSMPVPNAPRRPLAVRDTRWARLLRRWKGASRGKKATTIGAIAMPVLLIASYFVAAHAGFFGPGNTAHITVYVTDAPADDVTRFEVTFSHVVLGRGADGDDWITLSDEPKEVDLAKLRDAGEREAIASADVAAGHYDRFRLFFTDVVAERNGVPVEVAVDVNSITFDQPTALAAGARERILIDIDLAESLVDEGGRLAFRPVVASSLGSFADSDGDGASDYDDAEPTGGATPVKPQQYASTEPPPAKKDTTPKTPTPDKPQDTKPQDPNDGSGGSGSPTGTAVFYIRDAPMASQEMKQVNVTLGRVSFLGQGASTWADVTTPRTPFDLMTLRGSAPSARVITATLEAGPYEKIEIFFSNVSGTMKTADQRASVQVDANILRVLHPYNVVAGQTVYLLLDVDLDQSMQPRGLVPTAWKFQPVLRDFKTSQEDSDKDGIPDFHPQAWDMDNDNDGVPDWKDDTPYGARTDWKPKQERYLCPPDENCKIEGGGDGVLAPPPLNTNVTAVDQQTQVFQDDIGSLYESLEPGTDTGDSIVDVADEATGGAASETVTADLANATSATSGVTGTATGAVNTATGTATQTVTGATSGATSTSVTGTAGTATQTVTSSTGSATGTVSSTTGSATQTVGGTTDGATDPVTNTVGSLIGG